MATRNEGSSLEGSAKEAFVTGMFDRIAQPYDRLNRIISMGRDESWRAKALDFAVLSDDMDVADLGCGTGDFYLQIKKRLAPESQLVGLDLSAGMLDEARRKAKLAYPEETADLRLASAADTGLESNSLDLVTMGWVLRNVADRAATYAEILRILRPGGCYVCIDMSQPGFAPLRWASALYLKTAMQFLVRSSGGDSEAYRYLDRSTARFPNKPELAAEWREAGFERVEFQNLMLGTIGLHRGFKPQQISE